ncbi:MAG: methionine adenosyltransferase [Candidatus Thermoplasmatota archaeon]|jgi:S-adenosylmethionine synthetase|nr:methionine adenosyltransferase [Candidatus Thermoplasmatota archaeon]MCL5963737.1 methionine adenosyltransferase [Candidatus Thermoplasmatota archaeon]
MKDFIKVESHNVTPMEKQSVEIVERKGIGHPDSLADGISESVSRALSNMYIERYGRILHHNTDETQIVGGQSEPKFGGGEILDPIYILLVGRATTTVNGERLPYRHVALRAAEEYLKNTCKHLDINDVILDCKIGQGSVDLRGLYETKKHLANDTSFGVGFAPLSETETIVYNAERFINNEAVKKIPAIGEDVKVMGYRINDKIHLTAAIAFVDSLVPDKEHYISIKEEIQSLLESYLSRYTKRELKIYINTADRYDENLYYLTVTGLSMENGDDGSVGRGNRANGIITPGRPMSLEAAAGKNSVTHVGKMYNIISQEIASECVKAGNGDIQEAYVSILSQIGKDITDPQVVSVKLLMADGNVKESKYKAECEGIVENKLAELPELYKKVLSGKVSIF